MQDKKQQSVGIKYFYSNTSDGFEYKKNCFSKLSIKIFITEAEKVYAYQMLLSFKTSGTYKKLF